MQDKVRIVLDVELYEGKLATKEAVAMAVEHLGKVRVVAVLDGKEKK